MCFHIHFIERCKYCPIFYTSKNLPRKCATTEVIKMKKISLPKIVSREQARQILSYPNTNCPTGLRNRVALQLFYRAGLRVSEACSLATEDVNVLEGYVYVQQGKGKRDRVIPIDPETIKWCKKWLTVKPKSEYFLCTLKGSKLSDRYLRDVCYRISKKTGIFINANHKPKPIHPHALRHCFATERLEEGFLINEVQQLLGHSDISTTMIYTQVRPGHLKKKMLDLSPLGGI